MVQELQTKSVKNAARSLDDLTPITCGIVFWEAESYFKSRISKGIDKAKINK